MRVYEYLNTLLNFYTELSKYPLSKLTVFRPDNLVEIRFQNQFMSMTNNLGFDIGRTCYVTGTLAIKNMRILEEILSPDYDSFMRTVKLKKNSCEVYAYGIHGEIAFQANIKFTTVNLFRSKDALASNELNAIKLYQG